MPDDLLRTALPTDFSTGLPDDAGTAPRPAAPEGYELLESLGRGGMGVVYRARDLALDRDVAVKVLREGLPDGSARRFHDEARISGQLQHPGIPAVHQVGTLADGRPFLAMKLIKGSTLADILNQRTDPSADRGRLLAIFEAVCQAVGYAHAHRVIHRDLKPANIMVGAFGEVQVMDWGLAKVLGEETPATVDTLAAKQTRGWTQVSPTPEAGAHTQAGSLVGTPAFIPPEQAIGEIERVNERADVFGLGALLAVILTGKPPYVGETFESVRVQAVRGKLEDCFARLDASGAEPDLLALCKQCLAFEPADRPADAGAVARAVAGLRAAADERARRAELERVRLEGEQATTAARSAERRKRRRLALGAAAMLAVALAGGLVATTWLYLEARAARRLAENHRREAEAINDFLVTDMLSSAAPEQARGRKIPVEEVLANAAAKIDHAFPNQPEAEARVRHTLGRAYTSLGLAAQAEPHLQRALELYQHVRGPEDAETLRVMASLVSTLGLQGDPAKRQAAQALCEQCLQTCRRVLPENHPVTLTALSNSANLLSQHGEHAEAERIYEQVLNARRSVPGSDPRALLGAMNSLASELFLQSKLPEAERLYQEVLEASQRLLGPDHPETLNAMHNLALTLSTQPDRVHEARPLAEKSLEARRRILGPEHWHTLASLNTLAGLFFQQGDFAEAGRLYGDLAATSQRVLGRDHDLSLTALNNLAKALAGQGKLQEAENLYRQTLEARRRVLGAGHPATLSTLNNLAYLLHRAGQLAEAEATYREVLELRRPVAGQEPQDALFAMYGLAGVLLDREPLKPEQLAEAESLSRQVVAARRQNAAIGRRYLANAVDTLGRALLAKGQPAEAEPLLQEAVDIYAKNPRAGDWDAANAQSLLGQCLASGGHREEAEPLLLAAYHSLEGNPNTPPQRTRQALVRIVQLYEAWPKPKQAAEWHRRLAPP